MQRPLAAAAPQPLSQPQPPLQGRRTSLPLPAVTELLRRGTSDDFYNSIM
jgi:hypothetical protein